jgi:hypothetical protein
LQGAARTVRLCFDLIPDRWKVLVKAFVLFFPAILLSACDAAVPGQPNVIIAITNDLVTSEDGETASFGVILATQPTGTVTIPVVSSNPGEGAVDQDELVFNSGNWSTPQTVIITGADDDVVDGDTNFTIQILQASSADPNYDGLDPADVPVTNLDNDGGGSTPVPPPGTPGVTVEPLTGLVTTEDGTEITISVVLNT